MRIHHINGGNLNPVGGRLVDGFSRGLRAKLVCHCWLIEGSRDLVLVDTGTGGEAARQVERLGFKRQDVGHIVLTHLDFDNAGGIQDFPNAQVHVLGEEAEAAASPRTRLDRWRYRPSQWARREEWTLYPSRGDRWYGFDGLPLKGLPHDVLLVPLPGHTWGHAGVAARTPYGWMLHAGDAYFYRRELEEDAYSCTLGLRFFQTLMEVDRRRRKATLRRLRDLVIDHRDEVQVNCGHDAIELVAYQARQLPLEHSAIRTAAPVRPVFS